MGRAATIFNVCATVLLLPGDVACNAFGVGNANNRDLLRMLINSFAWALVGAVVVGLVI